MSERCKHNNKIFLAFTDFRGYPEKLFVCDDCGIPISDFAEDHEFMPGRKASSIPVIDLFQKEMPNEVSL